MKRLVVTLALCHPVFGCSPTPLQTLAPEQSCPTPVASESVVALFTFDQDSGGTVVDEAGHSGERIGDHVTYLPGPDSCGQAAYFLRGNSDSYMRIPDHPVWDLNEGSVDFWVLVPQCPDPDGFQPLIARDAADERRPGHFRLRLGGDCRVELRIQMNSSEHCRVSGGAVRPGAWEHVVANFGPASAEIISGGERNTCAGAWALAGNDLPWIFGADPTYAQEPSGLPLAPFASDVGLDHVRIRSERWRP